MKKFYLLLALAIFMANPSLFAQTSPKHGIGFRYIGVNYQNPITEQLVDDDFTYGMEIEYQRYFNDFVGLALPFKIHRAELPTDKLGNFRRSAAMSLDAALQFRYWTDSGWLTPYAFGGLGAVLEDLDDIGYVAPVGLGLNFKIGSNTYLSTKAEYRFSFDDLRDNLQLGLGFNVLLGEGRKDTDKDGVYDDEDACPTVAGLASLQGCPDKDGDGITDAQDDCPTVAGPATFKGCPDTDGDGLPDVKDECPNEVGPVANNGCPILDADEDGVLDDDDECPTVPGSAATNGCPDSDGDGIADKDDSCPNQKGVAAFNGCPDTDGDGIQDSKDDCPNIAGTAAFNGCPDTDGDGIRDKDDACPTVPGIAANKGCPELKKEEKEVLDFAAQAIQFETGKSSFKAESYPVLDQIVEILKRYVGYNVRVEGHTDSVGAAETNQKLSEDRARACYDYFVSKGIPSIRISFEGFGETKPIANNKYKAGREKNRRVEFDVYIK